jgi:hypothetical protein
MINSRLHNHNVVVEVVSHGDDDANSTFYR